MIGEIVSGAVMLAGAVICALSVFGILRFPDLYLRSHAATKSATLGVLFILLGAFLYFWLVLGQISIKLLLGVLFVFITSPIAGHLNGRAAYRSGVVMWDRGGQDDLERKIKQNSSGRRKPEDASSE